jgi:hypothetical protein
LEQRLASIDTLIGETYGGSNRDEFMALFFDSSTKIATIILPAD